VFPRRQTTWQGRPARPSRVKPSRNVDDNPEGSTIEIFAPESDKSIISHSRAANPPSSVIHPDLRSDFLGARFFADFMIVPTTIARGDRLINQLKVSD
jgi:hypothetical protein